MSSVFMAHARETLCTRRVYSELSRRLGLVLSGVFWGMKVLFFSFPLIVSTAQGEPAAINHLATFPTSDGTYVVGDWKYSYSVIFPRTRSQGYWGRLYYSGKELSAPLKAVVTTPVGSFIFLGGLDVEGWGEHGWFNTLRDYSGNCSPVFEDDGTIVPAMSGSIKQITISELIDFNKNVPTEPKTPEPLLIENSRSPDGQTELWIKPDDSEGIAAGTAEIRAVSSGKVLGTFPWSGFGVHADSKAFSVLWRWDCKCFAIKWELTRGWMSGAVYAIGKDDKWSEVKLPSDDYVNSIKKLSHVSELRSGKGHDTPEKWLADGQLLIVFGCRDISVQNEDLEQEFEITARITNHGGNPLKVAQLTSIRPKALTAPAGVSCDH